jgi:hypothetical protein
MSQAKADPLDAKSAEWAQKAVEVWLEREGEPRAPEEQGEMKARV